MHSRTQRDGGSFRATAELSSRSRASHSLEHRHVKHREPPFCIVHDGRFTCIRIHAEFLFFFCTFALRRDRREAGADRCSPPRASSFDTSNDVQACTLCRRNDKSRSREGFGAHRHAATSIENGKPIGDSFLSRRTDPSPLSPSPLELA